MRGWQKWGAGSKGGLEGHCSPLPLARSLLQDSVMVVWHLPNRDMIESHQTHCTTVLPSAEPWCSVLRVLHALFPSGFPYIPVGARSQTIICSLGGTEGPQVTVPSCPRRYEEIQRAQEELSAGVVEVAVEARRAFAAVQQANAGMAEKLLQVTSLGQVSSVQAKAPACIPTPRFTHCLLGWVMLSRSLWHP